MSLLANRDLVDERVLYLDSKARVDSNEDIYNSSYILPQFALSVNADEYLEIGLQSFVTKYTFYNIDTGRNAQFDVSTDGGSTFPDSLTLTIGNVSAKELVADMQTQLRTVTALSTLTLTYTKRLFKILFTNLPATPSDVVFKFPANETGYELFGFNIGDTTLNGDGTRQVNLGQLSSGYPPRTLSIGNEEALFIGVNFGASSNVNMNESTTSINSTFAKVHIIAPFNGNIYYFATEASDYKVKFPAGSNPENQIRITITDEVGNFLKLQNDFQMVWRIKKFRQVKSEESRLLQNISSLLAIQMARETKKTSK
jgi:hypothetical protein